MSKTSLANTNQYLKGKNRKQLASRSTISSCGVEGIKTDLKTQFDFKIERRKKRIYNQAN